METAQFFTVDELAKKYRHAGFTSSSLRWMLFNRATNGLNAAVVQLGRKILIDEQAFIAWLRTQRGNTRAAA